uniref:Uncharacterized protein n=1 Tax=Lepeophtheirus salmonis TaxID=72036 RepID=A0A0K2UGJ3_LEPSM
MREKKRKMICSEDSLDLPKRNKKKEKNIDNLDAWPPGECTIEQ